MLCTVQKTSLYFMMSARYLGASLKIFGLGATRTLASKRKGASSLILCSVKLNFWHFVLIVVASGSCSSNKIIMISEKRFNKRASFYFHLCLRHNCYLCYNYIIRYFDFRHFQCFLRLIIKLRNILNTVYIVVWKNRKLAPIHSVKFPTFHIPLWLKAQ